jgi:HSP20 family protein
MFGKINFCSRDDILDKFPKNYPPVEVKEQADKYVFIAEIPGLEKEDIEIDIVNGVLIIKGEKKKSMQKERDTGYYNERKFGAFKRSFNFGDSISEDGVKARYKNGLLEIILIKKAINKQAN